jgi:hypothetical protein
MAAYRPARMKYWGQKIDKNFFTSVADRDAFQNQGCDLDSVVGDPQFIDPAAGDYRIGPNSPARTIGFENFPMDQFGVRSAHLKAIARVPAFPVPRKSVVSRSATANKPTTWLGAEIQTIQGDSFSAFGISPEDGGIHLADVPDRSAAYQAGLRTDDVIQKINDRPAKTTAAFLRLLKRVPAGKKGRLFIVRNQRPLEISVSLPKAR